MNFSEWFDGQFGKRPSKLTLASLRENLREAENPAHNARKIYEKTECWDQDFNTALYGWNAMGRGQ